jgi:hypothetical protein
MISTMSGPTLFFTILAAGLLAASAQTDFVQSERLNAQIGPANPRLYRAIRDGKDWKNPYLVIRRDGIEVIATGLAPSSRSVALSALQRTLIELPVTAWPYGRVVAIAEISIVAADSSDAKPTADNLNLTISILKKLQVAVLRWPG